ncbi:MULTISPECIES: cytochrome d ubiquinol oxidase subunit II [Pseudomonas]|jgi:cytochrome d ubiquinol oxidase subunit II|uniref:Cytochrome d ubiquinol oxidase subunit II n=2 Tax=Pseudomonas putida TaxID=303 RepID=A0A166MDJ9_PSEPU|nr:MULTISPECIES: cytochrome d ubiquinol oxidase subunit II [Pseudomonas]EKT4462135.1 cytochrome d ubiquinol oxidase subunit II [Pseudomonas putida]EKT4557415.1 cytochrome d ubiquinol oxidase subunit II [Pseudomonas putida]ELF6203859.1 cytochrome d ubiquinol oxidase subunit II [Pseudomonas putida]ELU0819154.1 cytochrome d ubiquinol oxidase subunit II [Pseudomonas putida]KAF0255016.1 cytochrome d ubiquinol oxidase subunit II [Pseudomonas putida]
MGIDLPLIWAVIIIFGVMMYVVMDGFDLGIGMLFPFVKGEQDRDVMMNTVAPVWDGNETWLILGGAGLFGAFPMAYAVVLEALYLPLILMLMGLIFRGVAFEFRFKATADKRHIWDKAFIGGSLVATFFQGVALGAFLEGFKVVDRHFAGGTLDWLTPFSLFCGVGLIVAYTLLGCTWLIMKTEGPLQQKMHDLARPLALVLLVVIGIVSLWTPIAYPQIADRWFSMPNLIWFMPVPLLVVVTFYGLLKAVARNANYTPFLLTLVLIFLGYSGLGISLWPNIIPPSISIWDAAAPPQSQGFMLVGTLFILPFILMYTFWSYYVFRGKVTHEDGYH